MKLSTFGFGIAFFLFAVVSGTWIFSEGVSAPQVAAESKIAVETGSDDEAELLVLGQAPEEVPHPPSKLTFGVTHKANPLRTGPDEYAQPPVQTASDLRVTDSRSGSSSVTPASVPKNDTNSDQRMSGFANDPFASPQDNFMESAGFPQEPTPLPVTPAPNTMDPRPLASVQSNVPEQQSHPEPAARPRPNPRPTSGSLDQADPFATGTSSIASPPVTESLPEPRISRGVPQAFSSMPTPTPAPAASSMRSEMSGTSSASTTGEGTGTPGPSVLEGSQTPHLTLEKIFPAEIVIDQPATIKTVIRNVGRSTARDVTVRDRVPQGTRLLSTSPQASVSPEQELVWPLGHLDGSEQLIVEMRVLPIREGEIGSVATVHYAAEASGRKMVCRPKLQVDVKAPQEVRLGEIANIEITISNPGTATAAGIVLEEYVPEGLYHKDGKVLVNKNVDSLKPKEAKKLVLPLTCTGSGLLVNRIVVKANGGLKAEEKTTIRALSPILNLEIDGAKQRFLERKSGYRLIVSNTGTASAENVDLVVKLPTALQFVSTNQSGVYESSTHTVHWALEELPPQEAGEIELILMPKTIGNFSLVFSGNGQNDLKAETAHPVNIDGISATSFDVVGPSLVEIGKEIVYEIRVSNKGTKKSGNVRIRANLSDGLAFVKADGPVRHQSQGGVVQFEPLIQLDSKGKKVYTVTAKCQSAGDHRISVQLVTDDLRTPITKEESIRVFQ